MPLVLLLAGIVIVVGGAELFFEALLGLAARTRIHAFSLTVVLSGFELENIAAGIAAATHGAPDAAAGTFLGATTFLALGVTGISGIIAPVRAQIPRAALVWTAVSPFPLWALARDASLTRADAAMLLVWSGIALTGVARAGRSLGASPQPETVRFPFLRVIAGLAALSIGGEILGRGIRRTVVRFGIAEALLGNTAIAAAVEAEEIARVAVPSKRGRGEIGIANVLGTIIHFTAFNAGVIALVSPLALSDQTLRLHLPIAALCPAAVCILIFARAGVRRVEGVVLAAMYAGYVAVAVAAS